MSVTLEIAFLEGGHDTGLDAEAPGELRLLQIPIPYVNFPSHPLAALQLVIQLPQNVGGHGRSFCNLRKELSE